MTNYAEISQDNASSYTNADGTALTDIDSTPDNTNNNDA